MHPQIKQIISTIRAVPGRRNHYSVTLTSGQDTPMGKILGQMYYYTTITEMIEGAVFMSGYPHNGGEHSCYVAGNKIELVAFIEILQERMDARSSRFNQETCQVVCELSLIAADIQAR